MNPFTFDNSIPPLKRVKERLVGDAILKVNQWKMILLNGIPQSDGSTMRLTLNKAAEIIGIPKKSLEDYNQLFKKVQLLTDVNQFANEKMGVLRNYLRKNSKRLKKLLKSQKAQENIKTKQKNKNLENSGLQGQSDIIDQDSIKQNEVINEIGQHSMSNQSNFQKQDETSMIKLEEECNMFEEFQKDYESDLESNPSPLGVNFIFRKMQIECRQHFEQF
ncbi:unnamed protein product (macronuclear) [Paramecium tetraurelia]|uniref:Uncharacterized protein n=1 Tax=Paramecium tetraurelia TaxID=5888 RepID=A0E0D4_PARTE|nr:uncharacterized protein GSPATT00021919001 [Paramecium tetraurelia]CAK88751.1 unnamed protein product [Paramecium tetraurelia]|eukprot:XP_001456148.1 hypothetical protein (macronuclear) [Paramecium tetraurelia strain d4-2]